ncbi:hypothetical protein KL939_005201 [Ogataea angusta]|nr:hypothetical protein KL939_005201 [Ogataea angusta]
MVHCQNVAQRKIAVHKREHLGVKHLRRLQRREHQKPLLHEADPVFAGVCDLCRAQNHDGDDQLLEDLEVREVARVQDQVQPVDGVVFELDVQRVVALQNVSIGCRAGELLFEQVDGRVAQHRLVQRGEVLAQRHDDGQKLVGRVRALAERARLGHVADVVVEKVLWRRFAWVDARLGNRGGPELVVHADGTVWRHLQQVVRQAHAGEVGIEKMVVWRPCAAGVEPSMQLYFHPVQHDAILAVQAEPLAVSAPGLGLVAFFLATFAHQTPGLALLDALHEESNEIQCYQFFQKMAYQTARIGFPEIAKKN